MPTMPPRDEEGRHTRFLKFKEEVEDRLHKWMADHAGDVQAEQKALPPAKGEITTDLKDWSRSGSALSTSTWGPSEEFPSPPSSSIRRIVIVSPSGYLEGGWVVTLDGKFVYSYYGTDAHAKATKLAVDLANGDVSPDDNRFRI